MIRESSSEHLYNLIHQFKLENKEYFSNYYYMESDIDTLIAKGVVFYSQYKGCLQIFVLHKEYFFLYLFLGYEAEIIIEETDLPICVVIIHKIDDIKGEYDGKLCSAGFVRECAFQGFDYDPLVICEEIEAKATALIRNINDDGYRVISPEESKFDAFYEFVEAIQEIPFWALERKSKDEFVLDSKNGVVKALIDKYGKICGAYYRYIQGNNEYGWIAVGEEYRNNTGFSLVLAADIMKGMVCRGHMGKDWIQYSNSESLRFHKRLGYIENKRVKEAYVLDWHRKRTVDDEYK